jgi:phage terminase Nu1 subunit (DNA packaging protein)
VNGENGFVLPLPDELIEAVARRVVELLQAEPERRFLSKAALAAYFGVPERRIRYWREHGLPGRKVGKVLMYDVAEVAAWIDREGGAVSDPLLLTDHERRVYPRRRPTNAPARLTPPGADIERMSFDAAGS